MKWNEVKTHKVEFEKVEWKEATLGMRYKKIEKEGRILRLIELTSEYEEKEWCLHGHIAIILVGTFKVEFKDHTELFYPGDVVWVPEGEGHEHKASVVNQEKMQMISFEI